MNFAKLWKQEWNCDNVLAHQAFCISQRWWGIDWKRKHSKKLPQFVQYKFQTGSELGDHGKASVTNCLNYNVDMNFLR